MRLVSLVKTPPRATSTGLDLTRAEMLCSHRQLGRPGLRCCAVAHSCRSLRGVDQNRDGLLRRPGPPRDAAHIAARRSCAGHAEWLGLVHPLAALALERRPTTAAAMAARRETRDRNGPRRRSASIPMRWAEVMHAVGAARLRPRRLSAAGARAEHRSSRGTRTSAGNFKAPLASSP